MEMIDRPAPTPQIETGLDAGFDVTHSHFNRVWYISGSIGRFGEGDAGRDRS